jgi:hypothetical protein
VTQNYSEFFQWKNLEKIGPEKAITSTVDKTHGLLKKKERKQNPSLWKKIL